MHDWKSDAKLFIEIPGRWRREFDTSCNINNFTVATASMESPTSETCVSRDAALGHNLTRDPGVGSNFRAAIFMLDDHFNVAIEI